MKKLKYIILDDVFPLTFGEYFEHSAFIRNGKVTSAGFCSIDYKTKTVTCWGESISLKVKSLTDDHIMLEMMYFNKE